MQTKNKQKAVKNLMELRLKMAEKFADLENGDITPHEAKAFTGMASVIVNSLKVEFVNNQAKGIINEIDFLDYANKNKDNNNAKSLASEILDKKPYEFHKAISNS